MQPTGICAVIMHLDTMLMPFTVMLEEIYHIYILQSKPYISYFLFNYAIKVKHTVNCHFIVAMMPKRRFPLYTVYMYSSKLTAYLSKRNLAPRALWAQYCRNSSIFGDYHLKLSENLRLH